MRQDLSKYGGSSGNPKTIVEKVARIVAVFRQNNNQARHAKNFDLWRIHTVKVKGVPFYSHPNAKMTKMLNSIAIVVVKG